MTILVIQIKTLTLRFIILLKNSYGSIHFKFRQPLFFGEAGQALLESIIILPLFISICSLFLFFIYDQLWTQIIEHILHEALICEKTLCDDPNQSHCLNIAKQSLQQSNILGQARIYKVENDYYGELKILGDYHWKTIHLKENHIQ